MDDGVRKTNYSVRAPITNWTQFLENSRKKFQERYDKVFRNRRGAILQDFERYQRLGSGTYSQVCAVKNLHTGKFYAMKILKKSEIVKEKQVEHTLAEKRTLQSVSFPFLVHLKYFFVDKSRLYFILPLAERGEIFKILRAEKRFTEETVRFYASQVVLALEYLHFLDLVYRDLKPENTVVFANGYIKLTDFGFCKIVKGRTYSFCGTPEYMAPEIINQRGYNKSVDWWALGIFIYELAVGRTPFVAKTMKGIYNNVIKSELRFPRTMNRPLRHLIQHLVEPDLTKRYGNLTGGVNDIKEHSWFHDIDWLAILNQNVPPPFIPPRQFKTFKRASDPRRSTLSMSFYDNIFQNF